MISSVDAVNNGISSGNSVTASVTAVTPQGDRWPSHDAMITDLVVKLARSRSAVIEHAIRELWLSRCAAVPVAARPRRTDYSRRRVELPTWLTAMPEGGQHFDPIPEDRDAKYHMMMLRTVVNSFRHRHDAGHGREFAMKREGSSIKVWRTA